MTKIVCKICGAEEDSSHFIPEIKRSIEFNEMCFTCLHWAEQALLDVSERGEHGWAVIGGTHYVLCPHTDAQIFRGYGGRKFKIRFFDGYETICDNLWCQGEIPDGHWKKLMPDNAEFMFEKDNNKIVHLAKVDSKLSSLAKPCPNFTPKED